jgi:hypothetical protein
VLDLTGSSGSLSITLLGSFNSADFTFTSGTNGTVIGYTGH